MFSGLITQSIACGFGCLGEKADGAIRTRGDSKQALTSEMIDHKTVEAGKMQQTAHQHKEVPDGVHIPHLDAESVQRRADGIDHAAAHQHQHLGGRKRRRNGTVGENNAPPGNQITRHRNSAVFLHVNDMLCLLKVDAQLGTQFFSFKVELVIIHKSVRTRIIRWVDIYALYLFGIRLAEMLQRACVRQLSISSVKVYVGSRSAWMRL